MRIYISTETIRTRRRFYLLVGSLLCLSAGIGILLGLLLPLK